MEAELYKCPFCFKTFISDAAVFKATTAYTRQDLEVFSKDEIMSKEMFLEKADPLYEEFWKQFPGSKPSGYEYEKHAVIAIEDSTGRYLSGRPVRDEEGFLKEVVDSEGRPTRVRICPHCHNRLPFEFGKYPVIYIAVVGITSSGKTIYLSQLFKSIKEILLKAGLTTLGTCDEVEEFVRKRKIAKNKPLPSGDPPYRLSYPLPINVRSNETEKRYTLIFYDISGESCVDSNKIEKYGKFIENSNGIILIVDPSQFSDVFGILEKAKVDENELEETARPEKVVDAMYRAFGSAVVNGKSIVPLAATLSKSDMLKNLPEDLLSSNSHIFKPIEYHAYPECGLAYEDWNNIDFEVRNLLGKNHTDKSVYLNTIKNCFQYYSFFAFSALNCTAVSKVDENKGNYSTIEEDPEPIRIEESLFWILSRLGIINTVRKSVKSKRSIFYSLFLKLGIISESKKNKSFVKRN